MAVVLAAGMKVDAQESVFIPTPGQPVHYNWGGGSPGPGLPVDKFTAIFDQSQSLTSGDYFIQALADDGVKVEVDNQLLINRWSNSPVLVTDRALWTGVLGGQHTVKTHYYEDGGNASVFSDVVPFDSWLAYYYPNENMAGAPTAAKIIEPVGDLKKLSESYGAGSPIKGINSDHFSARYTTAKRISAGEYILRAKADDGIRVYVDGNLVLDRWTPAPVLKENAVKIQVSDRVGAKVGEKDVHWIEVEYYEGTGNSQVDFSLEPFQNAIEDTWVAEYFPNMTLQGNPVVETGITQTGLNFNWKTGSPHSSIPSDGFSTRFTKSVDLQGGIYDFEVRADDGVRLWVDNQLVIDSWVSSSGELKTGRISLDKGIHTVKLEYFEGNGLANLSMTYQPFVAMPPQIGGEVHYNWGSGSPGLGIPADKFTALFEQSKNFTSGDYFIQALADDGIKMEVDGQWMINRWNNSPVLVTNRALWTGVLGGQHTVKTHYYEDGGNASVFSDVVPFDSWLAYYYPNENMAGAPTAAKIIEPVGDLKKLSESYGAGSPIKGINSDHFSARYTTAKRISAGEYILRAKADDGIRVYVDGNLVLDRWTPAPILKENAVKIQVSDRADAKVGEKDVHWIEVEYYEGTGNSQVDFSLEPFQNAIEDTWVAEYFPNMTLQGNPVVETGITQTGLNFNWKTGSPHSSIPSDGFSTRFTKSVDLQGGIYDFEVRADDGVRLWVDNQLVIDSWVSSSGELKTGRISLDKGRHTVKLEYFEGTGLANLSMTYQPFVAMPPQIGGEVHYNWGSGSPGLGIPADKFTALFDQSKNFTSGDYFIQALADDGIKMEVDGQWLINRWNNSPVLVTNRALWTGVLGGQHTVKTHYYEDGGNASVFSDVVPFDSWLAYYYPNENMAGAPTAAKIIEPVGDLKKLSESYGAGSPIKGINSDHFSARYTTAKRISAGEYILRAKADDGIRVYVDGNLVLDRWTSAPILKENAVKIQVSDRADAKAGEKDVHWIEVEYFEGTGNSQVDFFLEPFQKAIEDSWVAEYYPNTIFQGNPYVEGGVNSTTKISTINFDWKADSPDLSLPANQFSARFTKKMNLQAGTYLFDVIADDGIRVKVDNNIIIDSWNNRDVTSAKKGVAYVNSGYHTIEVEYYEGTGNANLSVDYKLISPNRLFYNAHPEVDYYWGSGSPSTFPADNFEAIFNQSQYLSGGDYFLETISDDGVQVEVDGQTKIDMWNSSAGNLNQAFLLNQKPGEHNILTRYYEATGLAFVYSHLVKFDDWIAYYYPNPSLSGIPTAAKVIPATGKYKALSEINSNNSPVPGSISQDNFSAVYRTAKKLDAGEYVIRGKADDGIRVYIDGNLVFDRWTPGSFTEDAVKVSIKDNNTADPSQKNVHWIQVEYFEGNGSNDLEFFIQPYNDVVNTNQWVGFVYPNKNLSGIPMILGGTGAQTPINDLNFNWGTGTPHAKIPSDGFSAKFVKQEYFNTGKYQIKTFSDDGIRVFVDGSLKIDSWVESENDYKDAFINLNAGIHEVVVEYYDNTAGASLNVDIDQVNATSYMEIDLRTRSNITADEIRAFFDRKGHANNPLKAYAQEFINAQEKYGVNAQYLVAHAIWETGWANPKLSSLMSYKNNLFGYGAYDSCPFTCGYYFPSGQEAIFHEAYIVRKNYLDENGIYYNGPTLPGMNVRYATDGNWANGISNLMQQMKPLDGSYYMHTNIIPGSLVAVPSYGRDIPVGLPYPTNIVINYPTDTWATVITNGLTLRSIPYTSASTSIGTLTSGTVVKVLGYNTDVRYQQAYPYDQRWYRVLVNGQEGWLYGGGLRF